ncbi:hypothetical protein J2736_004369 [Paenibacillus qinlingensis]|uniref:Lipoprotein n=1 Tax=Paenibacillus qinlingensis TaxID=1837343 RepID=A0ABU1P272_9BACL|nr:hypothetical protein [Paenibacillus qinlingensis]
MYIRRNVFILFFVTLMTVLLGCSNHSTPSNSTEPPVLTTEIRKITLSQLKQITKDMSYKELIHKLGNTKDIGSGISIFRYKFANGKFLDINMFEHDLDAMINEDVYQHIQNVLKIK